MPQFAINCSSLWNIRGEDSSESLSENRISSKLDSPPRNCMEGRHLGSGLQDQDSSSSQSTIQSHQDGVSVSKTNSHDQCASSKTVHDESYHKHIESQVEPAFFVGYPDLWTNSSQYEMSQSSIHIPNFSGLFTAYAPHPIVQQQIMGIAPGRVPLPADLAEDGPIYVNAKQYHGILRRRQVRAKLEAQNKLVKTRKPYLHESRHVHALNRVRGSGGRFLSTKKAEQTEAITHSGASPYAREQQAMEGAKHGANPTVAFYGITQNTNGELNLKEQQADHRFSSMSSHMAASLAGRGICNAEQRGASAVR